MPFAQTSLFFVELQILDSCDISPSSSLQAGAEMIWSLIERDSDLQARALVTLNLTPDHPHTNYAQDTHKVFL